MAIPKCPNCGNQTKTLKEFRCCNGMKDNGYSTSCFNVCDCEHARKMTIVGYGETAGEAREAYRKKANDYE